MQGLDWQTWRMAFLAGLNQKASSRELEPPALTIAKDCQFDKVGDLQTRYPFSAIGANILGGGTISNARRIVENGDEKLLFTKDTLYSWNAQLSKWVSKGTHLACKVTEKNVFVTGNQQIDIDRAELSNTIVYTWTEGTTVYVAALDKTTGSVSIAPTAVSSTGNPVRPRLVALETKILLFTVVDGTGGTTQGLVVRALDPADLATGLAGAMTSVIASTATGTFYDVTRVLRVDQAVAVMVLNPTTSYRIATVTGGLVVAGAAPARGCDGVIAVACNPDGTHAQVVRANGGNIVGDYIAISGFTDVYTAQAIGTIASDSYQIAAAFRSVTDGGAYRCYVFWSSSRATEGVSDWTSKYNWVDTGNNISAQANFLRRMEPGSRAFDHEGRVYLWMAWSMAVGSYGANGQIQNASYLYRDDAFLVAKSAWNRGGGYLTRGLLPGVALTSGTTVYSYAGTDRAVFGELAQSSYSGKRPRDVTFTFDSNEARRCVRMGKTLYICGGELLQYDGQRLTEVGFHVWPWYQALTVTAAAGSVAIGTYGFKCSYRSTNAQGEVDRSASINIDTIAVTTAAAQINVASVAPLYITHKPTLNVEVWRSLKDPNSDDPYYLDTASDPSATSNPNRYLPNDTTASTLPTLEDDLADASLSLFGTNPQDSTLPSLAAPAASIICATDARLFLAGVAGEPNAVWYSKQRADGEVAAFHGALVAQVPPDGGVITSVAFLNETLVVFCETAIYTLPGDGFDNTGGGQNYGPARTISTDIGAVNHESVCVTDSGLVFKSSKGWYRLNRGFGLDYIGANVVDYDSETPLAVQLVESQHQLRILTSSRTLVLDTLGGQWFEWTITDGLHACMWQGTHTYLATGGAKTQQTTYTAATYGMDVETAWIDLSKMQAFGRIRRLEVRGEYRAAHSLRVRLARDFWVDGVDTYFQDRTWTPSPTVVGGPLQLRHDPSIQQLNALKVRLTITPSSAGESVKLSALLFELGFKRGLFRRLPSAQTQ